MTDITPRQASAIASQWGSYISAGDPGSVFYSLSPNDARPHDEHHRLRCIAYTDRCIDIATQRSHQTGHRDDAEDLRELRQLRRFFVETALKPGRIAA